MPAELLETWKQHVRHSRPLYMLPERLDEVRFGAIVGKPERLDMLFDIL
jgi:hypothetical protein